RTKEMPEIARPSVRIVASAKTRAARSTSPTTPKARLQPSGGNNEAGRTATSPPSRPQPGLLPPPTPHPPPPGVLPFAVNSRQWQDGATEEHWLALPGASSVTLHAEGKPVPGLVYWHSFRMHFPKDAVLMRTLSLAGRRVETQLLHFEGADWRTYTYAWRDDQADADLVPADGDEKEVGDGKQKRLWQFPSRSQGLSCHSNQSEYALAFAPEQLNGPGPDGRHQLVAFTQTGVIHPADAKGRPRPP